MAAKIDADGVLKDWANGVMFLTVKMGWTIDYVMDLSPWTFLTTCEYVGKSSEKTPDQTIGGVAVW